MRKVVPPKLEWKYIGDESPEKRKESEERIRQVYDRIFTAVAQNIRQRKHQEVDKIKQARMKLNKDWHLANKMPKSLTLDQRIKWHLAHAKNCACRPLGGKILEEIKKRGLKV